MKVILCCFFLFILLACPVSAVMSPIPAATKVAIAIPAATLKPTLEIAGLRTLQTTTTPTQNSYWYHKITSNPPGAEIFVNGEFSNQFTPYSMAHSKGALIILHPQTVMLKYPGYEDYIFEPYTLTGSNITLHADMVPLPVTTPSVTSQAAVVQSTGTIPQGQQATKTQATQGQVFVTGSQAQVIGSSGSLSITTTPSGAEIFIDNEMKGVSPATISGLSAGTHSLGIVKEGYRNISTTISIDPGQIREYSTGLIESTSTPEAPGFSALLAIAVLSAILIIGTRKK
jgi:hypothetical protein